MFCFESHLNLNFVTVNSCREFFLRKKIQTGLVSFTGLEGLGHYWASALLTSFHYWHDRSERLGCSEIEGKIFFQSAVGLAGQDISEPLRCLLVFLTGMRVKTLELKCVSWTSLRSPRLPEGDKVLLLSSSFLGKSIKSTFYFIVVHFQLGIIFRFCSSSDWELLYKKNYYLDFDKW